ncbi:MAG TPA: hypothetical protein VNA17_09730 [Pyrinomonadaceae bacterium]|nr:hypothetical protein [Pyrinomonadaceae bacterium]
MYTSGNIRTRGVVVMIAGLFIAGLMAAIAVGVGLMLAGAMKDPSSARKINDEFAMLAGIYVLFAALIGLGLQFVVTGGWMLAIGKRNRILVWLMWAGIIVVFGFGFVLRLFL